MVSAALAGNNIPLTSTAANHKKNTVYIKLEVTFGVNVAVTVSWDVTPCDMIDVYQLSQKILPPSSGCSVLP